MNIGILGFGTVGSGVFEILTATTGKFSQELMVSKVFNRPLEGVHLCCLTHQIEDILEDPSIDCVVEALGGLHPAYEYIVAALKAKKHVVTANKAVVAAYMQEFLSLAKDNGVQFYFEATTGGGIPWIASLEKIKRIDPITYFYGIFNGTGNYILDAMFRKDQKFTEVLKKAQELGYAEADPSADIDGYDVMNKVIISAAVAFNAHINREDIPCYTMRTVKKQDIDYLKKHHLSMRYIGEAHRWNGSYEAFVMPNIFSDTAIEANVSANFNVGTVYGPSIGPLKFYGQGAGKLPTANAIVQDLLDIKENPHHSSLAFTPLTYDSRQKNAFLIRTTANLSSPLIEKEEEGYYHTGKITAPQLKNLLENVEDDTLFVAKFSNFKE